MPLTGIIPGSAGLVYEDVHIGDVTSGSGNYVKIADYTGTDLAFVTVRHWSANSDCFNVIVAGQSSGSRQVYLIAKSGTTVTNLTVRYWYYR